MNDVLNELLKDINNEYGEVIAKFNELNMDIDCNPYWTGYIDALDYVCQIIESRL